jgi:hypothetical protein
MRVVAQQNPIARLLLLSGVFGLLTSGAWCFDVILDPQEVAKLLAEIGKFRGDWKSTTTQHAHSDALYEMGERVLDLADLMTKDLDEHGFNDANLAGLILRRLREYGITLIKDKAGWHYDMEAFREYLRTNPQDKHAADARYALTVFDDPGEDEGRLQKSVEDKEQFIRDYPKYSEIALVKFLLAQEHAHLSRLYSSQKKTLLSTHQQKLAIDLYRQIVRLYPQSPEAEPAADFLVQIGPAK